MTIRESILALFDSEDLQLRTNDIAQAMERQGVTTAQSARQELTTMVRKGDLERVTKGVYKRPVKPVSPDTYHTPIYRIKRSRIEPTRKTSETPAENYHVLKMGRKEVWITPLEPVTLAEHYDNFAFENGPYVVSYGRRPQIAHLLEIGGGQIAVQQGEAIRPLSEEAMQTTVLLAEVVGFPGPGFDTM